MRQLTKIDVLLHKVGINTECFKYWNTPRAEEVIKKLQHNKRTSEYRRKCIIKCSKFIYDFTGEYDIYLNQGMSPYEAWHEVMTEFVWK